MAISVNTSKQQITASVAEDKITATVSAGFGSTGPQGASGVVTVSAPLVNAGTASAAQLSLSVGAGLQVSGGSLALASHTHTSADISDFTSAVIAAAPPTTNASLLTSGTLPDARLSANIARTSDVTNSLAGKVDSSDSRLTDAREWSADTVSQAEAEAGTATTRRAWTAQRVFQAIAAWWATVTVGTSKIANGAVTSAKIAANQSVEFSEVGAGEVRVSGGTGSPVLYVTNGMATPFAVSGFGLVVSGQWQASAVGVAYGGTGATDAATARTNLGAAAASHTHNAGDIASGTLSASRLPIAAAGTLGAVRIGSGISIDGDGVISASSGYTLPTATNSVLGGVKIGSGVTITDGVISVSTNYAAASHTHAISDVTDLASTLSGIDSAISGKLSSSDASVTNSREWSADTVSQAEAEAGTATTRRAWTAQRVFQAIAAWWATVTVGTSKIEDGAVTGAKIASSQNMTFRSATLFGATLPLVIRNNANTSTVFSVGNGGEVIAGDWEASPIEVSFGGTGATNAATARTNLGAAAVSHTHSASDVTAGSTAGLVIVTTTGGALSALAQGTAGQVLKVNGTATGVEWGAAAADVSIDTTAADILSASSGSITADDPGADRLVFWDDSAGKLTHLEVGTGLSISGTTMTATVENFATVAQARTGTSDSLAVTPLASQRSRHAAVILNPTAFATAVTTANGGSVLSGAHGMLLASGTTANGSALVRSMGSLGEQFWASRPSASAMRIDWSAPRSFWCRLATYGVTTNGVFRCQWGKAQSTTTLGRMAHAGIGIEIVNRRVWLLAHDGTSITAVDSEYDVSADYLRTNDVWVVSDGAGTVRLFINETEYASTTAGPTGISAADAVFTTEVTNGGDAANHRFAIFKDIIFYVP